jgi:nitroimidazol reductase NimA-like FMN-containing flavoprotein (pyridoxamine 5'-phosphate oxidase superfamily)
MGSHIFLSHAGVDNPKVSPIAEALKREGLVVRSSQDGRLLNRLKAGREIACRVCARNGVLTSREKIS